MMNKFPVMFAGNFVFSQDWVDIAKAFNINPIVVEDNLKKKRMGIWGFPQHELVLQKMNHEAHYN